MAGLETATSGRLPMQDFPDIVGLALTNHHLRGIAEVRLPKCLVCHESADEDFNVALGHLNRLSGKAKCSRDANQVSEWPEPVE